MFCDREFCKGGHKFFFKKLDRWSKLRSYKYIVCDRELLLGHLGCTILNSMKGCPRCQKDNCYYSGHIRQIY